MPSPPPEIGKRRPMRKNFVLILSLLFPSILLAEEEKDMFAQSPIVLTRTQENIVLDGFLHEESWFEGQPAQDFWEYFPQVSMK